MANNMPHINFNTGELAEYVVSEQNRPERASDYVLLQDYMKTPEFRSDVRAYEDLRDRRKVTQADTLLPIPHFATAVGRQLHIF